MTKPFRIALLLILSFGTLSAFGQVNAKARPGVILELFVQDSDSDTFFIPINLSRIGSRKGSARGVAKDSAPDYKGPPLPPGYTLKWDATVVDKKDLKVSLWLRIDDGERFGCIVRKEFFVMRDQRNSLNLRCGVKLTAFYGAEPIEEH